MNRIFLFFVAFCSTIAMAQYMDGKYIADSGAWQRFLDYSPSWLIVGIPFALGILIFCRALAEILFLIKDKTENAYDNKIYDILMKFIEILAKVLGTIGIGQPKTMLLEKVEKLNGTGTAPQPK
jgi:hypothetical protein